LGNSLTGYKVRTKLLYCLSRSYFSNAKEDTEMNITDKNTKMFVGMLGFIQPQSDCDSHLPIYPIKKN